MPTDGLVTVRSSHDPKETMSRLEVNVRAKGLTIFAQVDHAAGAAEVGLPLRAPALLIFGNAKGGTPLMQLESDGGNRSASEDHVWQDSAGATWLSRNDPAWLVERHAPRQGSPEPIAQALTGALPALAKAATELQQRCTAHADSNSNAYYLRLDIGAGEGIRTLDPNLGKVVLYP